ncbi:tryptophanase-like [Montipora foliosa]|uniref:tryptophanase-like n=1 Tax=Montipora foliosa TaxID=591990 RepID=UPI0035F1BD00
MDHEHHFQTFYEPFRIKTVEKIKHLTQEQRVQRLEEANYNPFMLNSDDIVIDLLTDSGTGAMSADQWAGVMKGDESYAGSPSYRKFEKVVKDIFGFRYVFPTHQGRAAERILFQCSLGDGDLVPSNKLFDTTQANVQKYGGKAMNLPIPEALDINRKIPFKGNIDIYQLKDLLTSQQESKIAMVMITITNNAISGAPVSMENIKMVSKLCRQHGIPFFLDACRFAENVWFIKTCEDGYAQRTPLQIAREIFSYADGCTMSAKKNGLVNIGGFLALNDKDLAEKCRRELIISEGFVTYGGLAGRDLEAIAVGLREVLDGDYLRYQVGFVKMLADLLIEHRIPVLTPPGGHAVYVDAAAMLTHIPENQFPAWALVCALYVEGGIRCCEIGGVMHGRESKTTKSEDESEDGQGELVRLAIPRRTYTESHIKYVAEVFGYVYKHRRKIGGYIITWAPPVLRHFSVRLKPMTPSVKMEEVEEGQEVARQVQGCCNSFSRLVL